jgi:hypothetical protein
LQPGIYDWTDANAALSAAIWKARSTMSHESLHQLIQSHQEAMESEQGTDTTHESILSILQALASHEITKGHALRLLGLQALRDADDPAQAALYRQAVADLRQRQ